MTCKEFIENELCRFNKNYCPDYPFRVAVSCNYNGSDYAYGGHSEFRLDYADHTIGYAVSIEMAERLLKEAWNCQERINNEYWEDREQV